jgi:hypothetical protein
MGRVTPKALTIPTVVAVASGALVAVAAAVGATVGSTYGVYVGGFGIAVDVEGADVVADLQAVRIMLKIITTVSNE